MKPAPDHQIDRSGWAGNHFMDQQKQAQQEGLSRPPARSDVNRELFISNLPPNCRQEDVRDFFETNFGAVEEVKVRQPRGYNRTLEKPAIAFLTFRSHESYQALFETDADLQNFWNSASQTRLALQFKDRQIWVCKNRNKDGGRVPLIAERCGRSQGRCTRQTLPPPSKVAVVAPRCGFASPRGRGRGFMGAAPFPGVPPAEEFGAPTSQIDKSGVGPVLPTASANLFITALKKIGTERCDSDADSKSGTSSHCSSVRRSATETKAKSTNIQKPGSEVRHFLPTTDCGISELDDAGEPETKIGSRKTIQVEFKSPREKWRVSSDSSRSEIDGTRELRDRETNTEFPLLEEEILKELMEDPEVVEVICQKFPHALLGLLEG